MSSVLLPGQVGTIETPQRKQAIDVMASFERAKAQIAADDRFTSTAKRQAIAQEYVKTRDELARLRADEEQQINSRRGQLEKSLFGLPAGHDDPVRAVAARDARDRAAAIDEPGAALERLASAKRDGDQILAKAIAGSAHDRAIAGLPIGAGGDWQQVVNAYSADHPTATGEFQELAAITRHQTDMAAQLGTAFAFTMPMPSGISRIDIAQVEGQPTAIPVHVTA